jgi:hypothetical protein
MQTSSWQLKGCLVQAILVESHVCLCAMSWHMSAMFWQNSSMTRLIFAHTVVGSLRCTAECITCVLHTQDAKNNAAEKGAAAARLHLKDKHTLSSTSNP